MTFKTICPNLNRKLILWSRDKTVPLLMLNYLSWPILSLLLIQFVPLLHSLSSSPYRHKITTLRPTYQNHLKSCLSTPYCWPLSIFQCCKVSWINTHAFHMDRIFGDIMLKNTMNQIHGLSISPLRILHQPQLLPLFSHFIL